MELQALGRLSDERAYHEADPNRLGGLGVQQTRQDRSCYRKHLPTIQGLQKNMYGKCYNKAAGISGLLKSEKRLKYLEAAAMMRCMHACDI